MWLSFRTLDNDGAIDGTVFFIKADNTEWNSGSTADIAAVEIDATQFDLTQNPQTATAGYSNWHSLPQDLVDNKGSSIWNFYNMGSGVTLPDAPTFQLQAETVAKNDTGNYVLQHLHVLKGWTWSGSNGVNWQVSGVFAPPSGADSIVGVIGSANLPARTGAFTAADETNLDRVAAIDHTQYVQRTQLVGKETDRYASYTNAFIAATGYRLGSFSLFNETTEPTDDTNAVRQPDIADGSGVIAWGAQLRTDKDPDHFQLDGSQYTPANGTVLYISVWNRPEATDGGYSHLHPFPIGKRRRRVLLGNRNVG